MSEQRLYKVQVTGVIPVLAKGPREAEFVARGNIQEEAEHFEYESVAVEKDADLGVFSGCIPYGGSNDTCQEILEQN